MKLDLLVQLVHQLAGLLPHEGVQRADILKVEGREQRLALSLVDGALGQDQTEADDPSEELARPPGFLKVVRVGAHDIEQGLVVGRQEHAVVEDVAEMDEAIVGDSLHPFQGCPAARVIEDDPGIIEVSLSLLGLMIWGKGETYRYGGQMTQRRDKERIDEDLVDRPTAQIHAKGGQSHRAQRRVDKDMTLEEDALDQREQYEKQQRVHGCYADGTGRAESGVWGCYVVRGSRPTCSRLEEPVY